MGNIFRLESPVMKILTLAANLVCLNILWLLCSLPIVTAGASTAAMYYVVFQYINDQDDAVLKPFLKAFKENFRTATPDWFGAGCGDSLLIPGRSNLVRCSGYGCYFYLSWRNLVSVSDDCKV